MTAVARHLRWTCGLAACLALLLLAAACETVPITGRSQLMLISPQQEAQLGAAAFQQFAQEERAKGRLITSDQDPGLYQWVRLVGDRIIWAAGLQNAYRWEYLIINAPKTVNAAAIAGGKIIVYTGILPVAGDDTGLAVILGHEVAHVLAHHTAERVSQAQLSGLLTEGALAALGSGEADPATAQTVAQILGLGVQVGYLLPYSRIQESEADRIGLILMAKAGYDPRYAVNLWQRMEAHGGGGPPEFLSTHPSHGRRIAELQYWMGEAWQYYLDRNRPLPALR